jgi:folate-binding protein YgfZ
MSHFDFLSQTTVISTLNDDLAVLAINGMDSAKFLQGQLTCNLQDITLQQSRLGAHCTHKGRMIASFRLLQTAEQNYLFLLPKETLAALQKSLSKYIVFSKAKLHDASSDYVLRGISGADARQRITEVFGAAPDAVNMQQNSANGTAICINPSTPRYLCVIPQAAAVAVDGALSASAQTTDKNFWNACNIRDGIGFVRTETIEEFIPQMLNLQALDGISFTKGCYTGQEIVARMQYRGILKKAMYRISGSGTAPLPNTAVFQENNTQAVGHIVNAENIDEKNWEALAVINHDAIEHALHLENTSGITVLTLPYTL